MEIRNDDRVMSAALSQGCAGSISICIHIIRISFEQDAGA
jgi:hypothetical protein